MRRGSKAVIRKCQRKETEKILQGRRKRREVGVGRLITRDGNSKEMVQKRRRRNWRRRKKGRKSKKVRRSEHETEQKEDEKEGEEEEK